jgi:hypothetical protein
MGKTMRQRTSEEEEWQRGWIQLFISQFTKVNVTMHFQDNNNNKKEDKERNGALTTINQLHLADKYRTL